MATNNFYFDNRCVVVSDDAFELGISPKIENKNISNLRSYPVFELSEYKDKFLTAQIVLSIGYYSDACLDYMQDDTSLEFINLDETFKDLYFDFIKVLERYKIKVLRRKVYGLLKDYYDDSSFENYAKLFDYVFDCERVNLNACIDKIRDEHEYQEIEKVGNFSNGEAVYIKIS